MHVLRYLLNYLLKRKRIAIIVVIFVIISQIAELAIPIFTGLIIDYIIDSIEANSFEMTILFSGITFIVISALIRGFTHFIGRYYGYVQGERIIYEIRRDLFQAYESSSMSFFDEHHTGDLMARATTDLEPMAEFLVWGQRILLQAIVTFIGVYTVLFLIDLRLFLLIGIVSPSLFILSYLVSTRLGPLYFDIRNQYGKLTTVIQENISGSQVVRAFNAESREMDKFNKDNIQYRDLRAYAFKIRSVFLPLILFIVNSLVSLLVLLGGLLVIDEVISPGMLITLFTYFTMLAAPTRFLAFSLIMYQRVKAAGERIFPLIEEPKEILLAEGKIVYPDSSTPTINFNNVSFCFDSNKKVLSNINLSIKPGERVAILGPTGSGKTVLISLIPRFYDVSEGNIQVVTFSDVYDVKELELRSWRKIFGIVHQEPFLFGRSIMDNITFGFEEKFSEIEINEVVKIAQVSEFVDRFPEKYETIIGERGVTLSGGQKQRIAIARMLLRKPHIMILDDATSSVDVATETRFQQSFNNYLNKSNRDHTVIFITHRLSTAKLANRIVILNKGKIIEEGNHDYLMEKGRIYPLLYKTQTEGMADIKLAIEKITKETLEGE